MDNITQEIKALLEITQDIEKKLAEFYQLHVNCQINLTSIKNEKEFYLKHYLDSIYYFLKSGDIKELKDGVSLADIGSGGGFPGIVIGIYYPNLKISLIESIGKKCRFLERAINRLGLTNIEIIHSRVEDIKDREFDIITARGVSGVKKVLENSFNISNRKTKWIMYKGEHLDDELIQARSLLEKRGLYVEKIRVEKPIKRTYCIITY